MLSRLPAVAAVVLVCALGWYLTVRRLREIRDQERFAQAFLEKLQSFFASGCKDTKHYSWLTHESLHMQRDLGPYGYLTGYRPACSDLMYKSAAVITTLLPELYRECNSGGFGPYPATVATLQQTLQEVIVRHLGLLSERSAAVHKDLRNPLVWFREGVRWVLFLPLSILEWLGVASSGAAGRISGGRIGRLIGGLASLLALVSAVVTIVVGWPTFVQTLVSWWPW